MALERRGLIGNALTQPPIPVAAAPTDPSQVGLWRNFQDKLNADPNLRMALMTTALNLFRTPQRGQTGFDTFANAALSGVGTLDQLRQRDRAQGREDIQDELAERRTATAEERTAIAGRAQEASESLGRDRLTQQGSQFRTQQERFARLDRLAAERLRLTEEAAIDRLDIAQQQLNEEIRQFNARMRVGDIGPPTAGTTTPGSTGPERMAATAADAFIAAGLYPDDERGRALATLRSRGMIGRGLVTPQDRFDAAGDLAKDILLMNTDISEEDALLRAETFVNMLAERMNAQSDVNPSPEEAAAAADPLEGQSLQHPTQGTGTVRRVGEGQYVVDFPGGTTAPLTKAQIEQQLGTSNVN